MEKREKVLLGLMAATLVAAAVMYFPGGDASSLPGAAAPAGMAPDDVSRNVEQSRLSPEQSYRLGRALDPALPDVFFANGALLAQEDSAGPDAQGRGEIVYSGYIKVGQKLYAVINGVEYAYGDELAEGGYVVKSIDKNNVLLERTDGSTGRKFVKRVPLVEDDTDKIRIRVVKKR